MLHLPIEAPLAALAGGALRSFIPDPLRARVVRMSDQATHGFKAARRQRLPHAAAGMLACFWQVAPME
jgi:hypothetical protein